MDSRLDSIFKTRFRHTEPLDTRQAIRRHEPDSNNRKKDGRKKDDKQDLWEDQTTVSIRALKTFLRQLVTQQPPQKPNENGKPQNQQDATSSPPVTAASPAPAAARAASAYQRTYNATHDESIGGDTSQSGSLPDIELTSDEIRTIHKLIDALEQLDSANIDYLTLRKNDSFLQSLVEAVDRIR